MQKLNSYSSKSIAAGFHALSEPLRLQILDLLRTQELCVCELCEKLDVPQSKLSFHLKTLKEAGLVHARQEGRWIYYGLNLAQLVAMEQYLAEFRRFSVLAPARPCDE
ncbi:MAG: ArsR/SmtB family transcription factor [Leptolyngbya sp. IPPAS B-1204]|uniref:Winged helix-turn-helix transcriptional regulator n=1 Tax=Leptolyngbya sp. NK1-12 TaxID=2547451 RepID=A0AA96WD32_9CYAN|nr:metalloregulator ArsR/SmtB family transcription factor [Leptolyngbya sp. NK1-12]MBF2051110.1 winged helix-turn-helix transcriptional regulator [Elainella sp. C42_A2020_010]RNJ65180.1 MAG: ArsR family transcriptional regulator [Leptolyngbya sp. IPPAS B-1204]WNZ22899.1 winged helix-turn-helix transcriptional regulator [Leptolyngbya sp. NK1-12]